MRRFLVLLGIAGLMLLPVLAQNQPTGVTAEAINQANLRALPNVESNQVGEITTGTRYPVVGRSEFFPWVLLGDPETFQPFGWVFRDLVTIQGDINQVPFSALDLSALPPTTAPTATVPAAPGAASVTPAPPQSDGAAVTPGAAAAGGNAGFPTPSLTPTVPVGVTGGVSAEINIRYGPGVDYPIVGRAFAGDVLQITAYHTQLPWVQVSFQDSPNGLAWVAEELLTINGNLFSLPTVTELTFNLPTLTPTPSVLQSSSLPGQESVELRPEFVSLGERIWNNVLDAGFVPGSSKFGALYIQDLETGEAITFGSEYAFSGTSINKIAILVEYFGRLTNAQPTLEEARDIANTMICSENVATNALLGFIGQGDQLSGAEITTDFMQQLGLQRSFLTAPYDTTTELATATPIPRPVKIPTTDADQASANPNPTNQMTVEEMGWLLNSVYQCGFNESGPLIEDFDGAFTGQECRKILYVMSQNTVDGLLKAGVPADIQVSHKHGWIGDTHGNAALFFTPGGDYLIVMMLFEPSFLEFGVSLPVIANASREVYNFYNPADALAQPREGYIPTVDECNYTAADQLVSDLSSPFFLSEGDISLFYTGGAEATPEPDAG